MGWFYPDHTSMSVKTNVSLYNAPSYFQQADVAAYRWTAAAIKEMLVFLSNVDCLDLT